MLTFLVLVPRIQPPILGPLKEQWPVIFQNVSVYRDFASGVVGTVSLPFSFRFLSVFFFPFVAVFVGFRFFPFSSVFSVFFRFVFRKKRGDRTVSNTTLARRHLSVWIFCSILFSMGGAPAKKESAFTKAAYIPARRQSENAEPRLFGFILRRCTQSFGCKIPWPFFSRKPPALTSIDRRKSVTNPEIASINVC